MRSPRLQTESENLPALCFCEAETWFCVIVCQIVDQVFEGGGEEREREESYDMYCNFRTQSL